MTKFEDSFPASEFVVKQINESVGIVVIETVSFQCDSNVVISVSGQQVQVCVFNVADQSASCMEGTEPIGFKRLGHRGPDNSGRLKDGRRCGLVQGHGHAANDTSGVNGSLALSRTAGTERDDP
jgi:hypothetical protein